MTVAWSIGLRPLLKAIMVEYVFFRAGQLHNQCICALLVLTETYGAGISLRDILCCDLAFIALEELSNSGMALHTLLLLAYAE